MTAFKYKLEEKLHLSGTNDFGKENYDENRFGKNAALDKLPPVLENRAIKYLKQLIKSKKEEPVVYNITLSQSEAEGLERIYANLSVKDRDLLIDLIAYRYCGFKKIKLTRNTKSYWDAITIADRLEDKSDTYDYKFMHFALTKFNLAGIGLDIKLYFVNIGIATDFIIEQYAYKADGENFIEVKTDDVVLDIGACWGDTALYFANKAGRGGKVYSFEFIPGNIKLFNVNIDLNPGLKSSINLVTYPVSNESGCKIYYKDSGPGSKIVSHPFEDQTGVAETITIDDFVTQQNLTRVDFIKMDIEGAEPFALQGAVETIKRFKPTLAIAIYHSLSDFVNIPNWILDLNLGYEIFIDHFTIHAEETVCFARVKQ